jgi:hypothetical protein
MTPLAVVVFGVGLLVVSRLHAGTNRQPGAGIIGNPPRIIRRLVGASDDGVPLDDVIIALIGVLWVVGGAGLAITNQSAESPAFVTVTGLLIVTFVAGGIVATAIWIRREVQQRSM